MTLSNVMDGAGLARRLLEQAADDARNVREQTGVTPTLATVLVGDDPASATYVRMKRRRCEQAGVGSVSIELPAGVSTEELVARIKTLGDDPAIHGILLQHPVPPPIDRRAAFEAIPFAKDVDGVTATSLGRMIVGLPAFGACTPIGIMRLMREYAVEVEGAHAVVIGRSPILGRPLASLLINAHATVTLCHSRTRYLADLAAHADILVAAVGKPRFVQGSWVKPGAVVIDAGYNPGNIGDVDTEAASPRARLITPVPGGVGPMTIATLIQQTVQAAREQTAGADARA